MPDNEVAAKLSIKDRARFSSEAKRAESDIKGIGNAAKEADGKARTASGGFGIFGKAMGGIATVAKVGITALGVAGVAAVGLGIKFVKAATDAFETQQKYETVFGTLTPQINEFVKSMNQKFGIPTKDLRDAASMFAILGKSADIPQEKLVDFSSSLTKAGMDLASFYNVSNEDAFQALTSGLEGQVRPLRQYGIFLSDAAVQAEALKEGMGGTGADQKKAAVATEALRIAQAKANEATKKYGAGSIQAASANLTLTKSQDALEAGFAKTTVTLTDQQKVGIRQKLILAQMGDAQGDLERTVGSTANQWRMFKGRLQEAQVQIGNALLPTANKLLVFLNSKLGPAVEYVQKHMNEWAGDIQRFLDRVSGVISKAVDGFHTGGVTGFASALDDATGAGGRIEGAIKKVWGVAQDLWKILTESVLPALKDIGDKVPIILSPLGHLDEVTHFLADHTHALKIAIEGVVAVMVINQALSITLAAVEGAETIVKAGLALATGGLAAARAVNNAAMEEEAIASGVVGAILDSAIVTVALSAAGWLWHAASVGIDLAGLYLWRAATLVPVLIGEAAQLAVSAGEWLAHSAAVVWDTAVSTAWAAVGLGAMLIDLGIQLGAAAIQWALHTGAVIVDTGAQAAHAVAAGIGTAVAIAATVATSAWTAAQWALNIAMDANPIGLVVLAIVALVAIFILAWQHSTVFREVVTASFGFVWRIIQAVYHWVADNWPLLLAILTGPIGIAVYMIVNHWDTIKNGASAVVGWISDRFGDLIGFFQSIPGRIGDAASSMWNGISDAFKFVINDVIGIWNALDLGIHIGIDVPDWVPGIGGKGFHLDVDDMIPDIPYLHSGGTVTSAGSAVIKPDEEMIVLPDAASVIPLPDDPPPRAPSSDDDGTGTPRVIQLVVDRRTLAEVMIDGVGDKKARR